MRRTLLALLAAALVAPAAGAEDKTCEGYLALSQNQRFMLMMGYSTGMEVATMLLGSGRDTVSDVTTEIMKRLIEATRVHAEEMTDRVAVECKHAVEPGYSLHKAISKAAAEVTR